MGLLIPLTEPAGNKFYLDCDNIRGVLEAIKPSRIADRNAPPQKETSIVTYLMTNQGLQSFLIQEDAARAAYMVNAAKGGMDFLKEKLG